MSIVLLVLWMRFVVRFFPLFSFFLFSFFSIPLLRAMDSWFKATVNDELAIVIRERLSFLLDSFFRLRLRLSLVTRYFCNTPILVSASHRVAKRSPLSRCTRLKHTHTLALKHTQAKIQARKRGILFVHHRKSNHCICAIRETLFESSDLSRCLLIKSRIDDFIQERRT